MKITVCVLVLASYMTLSALAEDLPVADAGYNIPSPWLSKGLTPVKLQEHASLPPLVIADSGKAVACIVCPRERYYQEIAQLLKQYLDQATGAEILIREEMPDVGRVIFLGNSGPASARDVFERAQGMPSESLVVASIAEGVVLAGKDAFCENRLTPQDPLRIHDTKQSRGSFFAAIDFLERLVGCRFYFPGIGTHIPNLREGQTLIPPVSYEDAPFFPFRSGSYGVNEKEAELLRISDIAKESRLWNLLWRAGDTRMLEAWHGDSHWHEVFGKDHPEYFALRKDGSRAVGERGKYSAYRCYNSDGGFQAHLNAIDAFYHSETAEGKTLFGAQRREHGPNRRYIHWGVADAFNGCECPDCRAQIEQAGAVHSNHSDLVWGYFLRLAKETAQRWPGKIVSACAYSRYRDIPDFVRKNNPGNILISDAGMPTYGPYWGAYLKEPEVWVLASERIGELAALAAPGEKPFLWLHYPHVPRLHSQQHIPYPVPHIYQKFIFEHRDKLSGMFFNGAKGYSVALDGLMLYLMLKISWNPDIDVDACIGEYASVMLGPGAQQAGEYYKSIIDRWENTKWSAVPKDNEKAKQCYWKETYPAVVRDSLEEMLRGVYSATAEGTIYRDRARHLRDATAMFFEQGRFYDLGKVYKYQCVRWVPQDLDGLLKEHWRGGLKSLTLHRNDTAEPSGDMLKSRIYVTHDDERLYIAGRIDQADAFVTKAETAVERDSDIWATDSLEIFLCTERPGMADLGEDQKSQFHQIIIDPHGSIYDAYNNDNGVNLDLELKTVNLENRMFFELAIPFTELECVRPADGSLWYMNFYWNRPRDGKHEGYAWAGTGRYKDTSRFGVLEFSDIVPVMRVKEDQQ